MRDAVIDDRWSNGGPSKPRWQLDAQANPAPANIQEPPLAVKKSPTGAIVLASIVALTMVSCATPGTPDNGGSSSGEGVPYGADIAEFKAAFADVDPIVINTQTPAAAGSKVGEVYEAYFDYVTEYSDGKITFNVAYANAIAGATDVDDAISDGRLDMGNILPLYEPDVYPANAAISDLSFIGNQAPAVALLEATGIFNAVTWDTPQAIEELEAADMHLLLPWYSGDSGGILCPEPRSSKADLAGLQIVASGKVNVLEVEGLGASPVSIPYTELFESLQRGVVDCSLNSMRVASLGGLIPIANHFTIDDQVGLGKTPGSLAINKTLWESLPLVAQQVLFDGTKALLKTNIEGSVEFQVDGLAELVAAGGAVHSFDDEARAAINAAHDQAMENIAANSKVTDGQGLIDKTLVAAEAWEAIVADLGFPDDVSYAEFAEWHAANGYDLTEYVEEFFVETMLTHRP